MAAPTPPPMTTAVPKSLISDGRPSGPTTSSRASPASSRFISLVVLPTPWTISVIVPRPGSPSAIVRGMRSPRTYTRTSTNWPAWRLRAIRGASTTKRLISGARNSASMIGNIRGPPSGLSALRQDDRSQQRGVLDPLHRVTLPGRDAHQFAGFEELQLAEGGEGDPALQAVQDGRPP